MQFHFCINIVKSCLYFMSEQKLTSLKRILLYAHYLSLWNIKIIVIVVRHNERASVFFLLLFYWQLYLHSTPTLVLLLVNCPIIKMRSKLQYEEEFLAYYIFFLLKMNHIPHWLITYTIPIQCNLLIKTTSKYLKFQQNLKYSCVNVKMLIL